MHPDWEFVDIYIRKQDLDTKEENVLQCVWESVCVNGNFTINEGDICTQKWYKPDKTSSWWRPRC